VERGDQPLAVGHTRLRRVLRAVTSRISTTSTATRLLALGDAEGYRVGTDDAQRS
jgi:hypothetical protein